MGLLVSLCSLIIPGLSQADFSLQTTGQNSALVFQIQNPVQTKTQGSLTIQNIIDNDPLPQLLEQYLIAHNSPLAQYAPEMVQLPNWKTALAISYVESNMCIHQIDNNCSGMGGAPGTKTWRKYATQLDWFIDLNNLLNQPLYQQKCNTFRKMIGCYVQPGSEAWLYGTQKTYAELSALEDQASEMRVALSNQSSQLALADYGIGAIDIR